MYPLRFALYLLLPVLYFFLTSGCSQVKRQPPSGIHFVDMAARAGLHYRWTISGPRPLNILQTIGQGCAFLDFNDDGNLDILLVGTKLALYRGDGHGHFRDVTHSMGLDKLTGHFLGCAVGDYDNDGYEDIYLSGYRTGLLLHNEQGKGFRDVTQPSGLKPQPWGTSCGWADIDGNGRLDLVVANYVQFDPNSKKYPQLCDEMGVLTACPPNIYLPLRPCFYCNLGGGKFRDESQSRGFDGAQGKGLGIAFCSNEDGLPDILIANDGVAGDLFQNTGHSQFLNRGAASGTAFGLDGLPHAGMGADWADYDGDGRMDAVVGTDEEQAKSLYRSEGGGTYTDVSSLVGLDDRAAPYVTFGIKWLDYDNDGWPDLLLADGHFEDTIDKYPLPGHPGRHYRLPTQVFHNEEAGRGRRRFVEVSAQMGPSLQKPIVGRGLAAGDFDNDGRIDALIVDAEGPPLLLHNEGGKVGHWLGLRLVGTGRSNRDAFGARVTVTAGGRTQVKEVQTAGSYLSASDKRLLFGLGDATQVETATIRWPDGRVQAVPGLHTGVYQTVQEPDTSAVPAR